MPEFGVVEEQRSLLEIEGLTVSFAGVEVLRGVDVQIKAGEAVGFVGESGSGKSVTWLAALGLLPRQARVAGKVRFAGKNICHDKRADLDKIRGGRIATIFQDPSSSLNPVMTVGRQISEAARLHQNLDEASARAEVRRLFDRVGLPDARRRMTCYPHELSGGQNQRVMIAMALAARPDILIADEPTTALDVTIQAQILELLREIQRDAGMALVLISHDLGVVSETCSRIVVMYAGRVVEEAPSSVFFGGPAHPYSQGLLSSTPDLRGPIRRLSVIPGSVPDPAKLPNGCPFSPRCSQRSARCEGSEPAIRRLAFARDTRAACFVAERHDVPSASVRREVATA